MPNPWTLAALCAVSLLTEGCSLDEPVFLQNPLTGGTVTCDSNYGRSSYLLTQFTGDTTAIRTCTSSYEAAGFQRIN